MVSPAVVCSCKSSDSLKEIVLLQIGDRLVEKMLLKLLSSHSIVLTFALALFSWTNISVTLRPDILEELFWNDKFFNASWPASNCPGLSRSEPIPARASAVCVCVWLGEVGGKVQTPGQRERVGECASAESQGLGSGWRAGLG